MNKIPIRINNGQEDLVISYIEYHMVVLKISFVNSPLRQTVNMLQRIACELLKFNMSKYCEHFHISVSQIPPISHSYKLCLRKVKMVQCKRCTIHSKLLCDGFFLIHCRLQLLLSVFTLKPSLCHTAATRVKKRLQLFANKCF